MFKKLAYFALAVGLIPLASGWITTPSVQASIEVDKAEVGKMAPDFSATDVNGETIKLSDLKGKNVVLEWTNHQCPFVVKHYKTGNMQKVQKTATDDGAVWISIVSSAPGKQGNISAEEAVKMNEEKGVNATTKVLDPTGEIGTNTTKMRRPSSVSSHLIPMATGSQILKKSRGAVTPEIHVAHPRGPADCGNRFNRSRCR